MIKNQIKINEEIELRASDISFTSALFQLIDQQREYLRVWLPWVDDTVREADSHDFLQMTAKMNQGGQRLTYFIFYKNQLAGSIGYVKIDKVHQKAEIGYWLNKDLQGNGIMIKCCKALVDYGFKQSKLNRQIIKVSSKNSKSIAIPVKLGFQKDGILRQDSKLYKHFHDVAVYSILKQEWRISRENN